MKRAKKRTHERMDADGSQKDGRADGWMDNASVNFSCADPPPPGNRGAFAHLVSPESGALANLARPGGRQLPTPGLPPGF